MVLTDEEFSQLSFGQKSAIRWATFKKGVWNSNTQEFCGQNKEDWGKTCLSYMVFYGIFAAFYACCFAILARTLPSDGPVMMNKMSILKNNPALNFEPRCIKGTSLVKVTNASNAANIKRLNDTFNEYSNFSNVASFGNECSADNNFGYYEFEPCIMIRINKVYGWDPKPADLTAIWHEFKTNSSKGTWTTELKEGFIPVSCEGQNEGDKDNILNVTFHPNTGIPMYHYPYYNQPNYQSPAIMVKFQLRIPGSVAMVWCRIWTSGIQHDMEDQQGSVRFELFVDPERYASVYEKSWTTNVTPTKATSNSNTPSTSSDTPANTTSNLTIVAG